MNCKPEAVSAYFDRELDEGARQDVERHLDACAQCSRELSRYQEVRGLLRPSSESGDLHRNVMARIAAAAKLPGCGARRWPWIGLVAAAVLAVLAGGAYLFLRMPPSGTPAPSPQQIALPAPAGDGEHGLGMDEHGPDTDTTAATNAADPEVTGAELTETQLELALAGTVTGPAASATIASASGEQKTYREGDTVVAGVRLVEVQKGWVILDNQGVREVLSRAFAPAVTRSKIDGLWAFAILDNEERVQEKGRVILQEQAGALTGKHADRTNGNTEFAGRLVGKHATLTVTVTVSEGDPVYFHIEGDFNDVFNELVGTITAIGNDGAEQDSVHQIKLTRITDDAVKREVELAAKLAKCREEIQKLYEPIGQYASEHENQFPSALSALVGKYVPNLDAYADTENRRLTYRGGKRMDFVRKLPKEGEYRPDLPMPDRLMDYERMLQSYWGKSWPSIESLPLMEVTYIDPSRKFQVDDHGGIRDLGDPTESADAVSNTDPALLEKWIASSQNNMKQFGLIVKMFQNEHRDYTPPGWLSVYPEYLTDTRILTAPWDELGTLSYEYLFPAMTVEELIAFAVQVRRDLADLDPSTPSYGPQMASQIPLVIENKDIPNLTPPMRNVLFLDGHVERIPRTEWSTRVTPFLRGR